MSAQVTPQIRDSRPSNYAERRTGYVGGELSDPSRLAIVRRLSEGPQEMALCQPMDGEIRSRRPAATCALNVQAKRIYTAERLNSQRR
jgi:hypothetical protein